MVIGHDTCRSKAAYGNVTFTLRPPAFEGPRVKVTLAFKAFREECRVELRRYSCVVLSYVRPNVVSKAWQTETGSQKCGNVLSMKA